MTRPADQVLRVLELKATGESDHEVSLQTGVPVSTIRSWRRRGIPQPYRPSGQCSSCGAEPHRFEELPGEVYSYLLGVYLGDGHLRRWGNGWTLRICLDASYPGIINECRESIAVLRGGREAILRPHHRTDAALLVESGWKSWPCLLPQHGRGRKHARAIALTSWQQKLIDAHPGPFLRGLIHTDGWRGVNRVRVKGREYEYPRYQFSNRSDDIRGLFTQACEKLGVEWRPWTRYHVSVAKRDAVALLDRHVGPKS